MLNLTEKQKMFFVGLGIFVISAVGLFNLFFKSNEKTDVYLLNSSQVEENINNNLFSEIVVHITGHILNPGIVVLGENSRIIDAIEAARWTFRSCRYK